ncbi:MAG TPA: hypothetical protein VFI19_12340, partial [Nocardioides sp.]|nr:hypothetical protein [Nocardioides sp.]
VVVAVAATYSAVKYVDLWQERNPSEAYFASVHQQLRSEAAESGSKVPLVDIGIPQTLLWAYRHPENYYSHVFRNLDEYTSYPRDAVDDLYLFDDHGKLAPVGVPPTRALEPTSGCGYELRGEETDVPLDGPVFGDGWWIELEYDADAATDVEVTAGDDVHHLSLPAGEHTAYVTAEGRFDTVRFSSYDADAGVCVSSLHLGLPQLRGGT